MMIPLKYKLKRHTLDTIYKSFVRPILEYADIVFDSCTEYLKTDLENMQMIAARVVCGTKRYTSHTQLYKETGWSPLNTRRQMHKLVMLQQIVYKSSPAYLTQILPQTHSTRITRQSNSNRLEQFQCRTESFKRSFFPSTIDSWNNTLDDNHRQIGSKNIFKRTISSMLEYPPLNDLQYVWYYSGDRITQVILSQMRVGFSNLNSHLYEKQCVDSPQCSCQNALETPFHFFYVCNNYLAQRNTFLTSIYSGLNNIPVPPVKHLLHGDPNISIENNILLLNYVHTYIRDTKRFKMG